MKKNKIKIPQNSHTYFQLVYPKIIETIRLSSAPAKDQISAFSKGEYPPDEIPYLIENAVLMAETLHKNGFINTFQVESIKKIDKLFSSFNKNEWSIVAMYKSTQWEKARKLSMLSLKKFSISYTTPNIYWLT